MAKPSQAAENLKIRFGFLEQSIPIRDLEAFVKKGTITPALKPYSVFLSPQIRQALTLQLPLKGSDFRSQSFLKSAEKAPFIGPWVAMLPQDSLKQMQSAISRALGKSDQVDLIAILKAYPSKSVDIDATRAISFLSQLNPAFLWTKAITPALERDLATANPSLKSSLDPALPGPETVQRQTWMLRDRQRQRDLPVELFWGRQTQTPLVVLSHGFGADRTFLRYLGEHLASYGFTVAAIEHPGSDNHWVQKVTAQTLNLNQVLPAREFIDRPLDISFLLDELARINLQPGELQGKLATSQVTVIGHSLGGTTALMLAGANLDVSAVREACKNRNPLGKAPAEWLQCAAADLNLHQWSQLRRSGNTAQLRDPRVVQVVALNPMIANLFGEAGLKTVQTPVLMLAATEDTLTPALSQQFRPFQQLTTPKYLVTAIGGTHLSVGDSRQSGKVAESLITEELQGKAAEPLRQLMRGVTLAFIAQSTANAQIYRPFLTPDYAQLLSQPQLSLRLNTEINSRFVN